MMASIAIASLFKFGRSDGVLKCAMSGFETGLTTGSRSVVPPPTARSVISISSSHNPNNGGERPTSWGTDGGASVHGGSYAAASAARAQSWADQQHRAGIPIVVERAPTGDLNSMPTDHDDPSSLSRPMQALSTDPLSTASLSEYPLSFTLALEVAFLTLGFLIKSKPTLTPSNPYAQHGKPPINPYITILLTLLGTLFKVKSVRDIMERYVPWGALADILGAAHRRAGGPKSSTSASVKDVEGAKFRTGELLPEESSIFSLWLVPLE